MKNLNIFLILLVFAGFFAGGCKPEDSFTLSETTPKFLLTASEYKKWEMIDPAVTPEINKPLPIKMPACPSSQVKNGTGYFYLVYATGKIDFQDGCGTTASDKALVTGTWEFNADKTTMTVTFPSGTQTWVITTLSASRLIVTFNGTTITFAPTRA